MIEKLNILDIVFMVVILFSILLGVIKGFIRELFSLAFLIIAVVLAFLFYSEAGTFLMKYLENREVSNFAGFVSIFAVVLIVGAVVTYFIKKILTVGPLKAVDRILGGVFGLLRGILLAGIIVFGLIVFPVDDSLILKSKLSPYVMSTIGVFLKLLPGNVRKKFEFLDQRTNIKKDNHDGKKNSRIGRTV
ncbi:MAG: CvpA family protein [bacterium]|nr:CvpA family protein [bacterium]